MRITSPAFTEGEPLPERFTCDGEDTSPPLTWSGVATGARSLALLVEDPDAAVRAFTHWSAWGIEPDTAPREVEVPADLAEALAGDDAARATFDGLAFTHRKEWVRWVEEAKKPETRATRLAKTVESLRAGKRAR